MHYNDHLDNLCACETVSAQKAVDYLDGYYTPYLETLLTNTAGYGGGIKDWKKRGVMLLWENFLGMIIEMSAKSYQSQPVRTVMNVDGSLNEDATLKYNELLKKSNFRPAVEDLDQLSRLLKVAVMVPQYIAETDELLFSVVSRNNCDVDFDVKTGMTKSLMYSAGAVSKAGHKLYTYWDSEFVMDLERVSENGRSELKIVGKERNTYKIVPSAPLYDIRKPRYHFWSKPAWEQLTYLNDGVNMYHIETKFNSRYGALGALFTNLNIPEGTVIGGDAIISVETQPEETPFVEYRSPQVEVAKFMDWLDSYKEAVADQWGVNLKVAGSGSADSGFKLVVEEASSLELRKKRINAARDFERQNYKVIAGMSEIHGWGLPIDGELVADFDEPSLPVDQAQTWTEWKEKIALNLATPEDFWRWENPDITEEELKLKAAANNGSVLPTLPNFDEGT